VLFVRRAGLTLTGGSIRIYQSGPGSERQFCQDCGSQLFFRRYSKPESVGIFAGTLDAPESFRPGFHVWTAEAVPWLDVHDDLPRYARFPP